MTLQKLEVSHRIPFNKPALEGAEIENILESIRGGVISGDGPFNKKCAEKIEQLIGARRALLTPSGTDALELCSILSNVGPGDEILMPAFTFVSTANAFCLRGAKPVFVDIRPDTLNVDEALLESAVTPRTRAIVPVHYAGVACEMDPIMGVARRHTLTVIEDAAQAFLCTYRGRQLGTIGDLGCFSFHETKTFTCGEGGAVIVNRPRDVSRAEILHEKGTDRKNFLRGNQSKYQWVDVGSSFVLSDLLAAYLLAQVNAASRIIEKRGAVFTRYQELLRPLEQRGLVRLPTVPDYCTTNYHLFYLLIDDKDRRNPLLDFLRSRGISAAFHYVPLHQTPYAQSLGLKCELPVTESSAARLIRLPFYNDLSPDDQAYIATAILDYFGV